MKNLYLGDRGILVWYLQLALNRAGYPVGMDGIFGNATCDALREFTGENRACSVDETVWRRLIPYLIGVTDGEEGRMLYDFPVVSTQVPYTSLLNRYAVEGLQRRYPFIQTGNIGKSVMGRTIPYLRIGTGGTQVFYNASFHANESITTPVLLKFAEEYAEAYAKGEDLYGVPARELFLTYQLYIVPMVNPDGVDLVNGFLTNGMYYRNAREISAAYPTIPFPSGWKANIDGVDLNLQFPAGWENAKEIKFAQGYTSPAPRDYVGSAPLVAPESAAVYQFTTEHDFSLILAYHTQGEVIYWKYLDYEPERSYEIAQYFGKVSGYMVEETPQESGYAGYKDWFIQEYDRPGYTIEAGLGENPLPMSQFAQIYEANKGILLGGMTQV
ncbi:MAG: M14 family zinc carboxypeptidase [Clostridiales bacterium]|nr:gamma-D-glutamyl-meso-diaminopimelate peptidase [Roseburia sp.]MDD7636942.1 M14 family zinc carboxypeptidase [Clostridiales bacterium]MDY4111272.1 M14 family zinc carboxypeptidase [Roseburia sp.]